MVLGKDTREYLKAGIHLYDGYEAEYEVVRIDDVERGKVVTLKCIKSSIDWMPGRLIYRQPLSYYYGMEMKEV